MVTETIDSLVKHIPSLVNEGSANSVKDSYEEARRRYHPSGDVDEFTRAEIEGAHSLTKAGTQMVYVMGRGFSNWNGQPTESLFYLPVYRTGDFFGKLKVSTDVQSIPMERIARISFLKALK